jgi:hypothetical protein
MDKRSLIPVFCARLANARVAIGLVAALTVAAPSAGAHDAAAEPIALSWSAPPGCPSRDAVLREIARSPRVLSAAHALVSARARVSLDDRGRWNAELEVSAGVAHNTRMLEAESCEAIAQATALIVELAVERETPNESPVASGTPPPEAPKLPASAAAPRSSASWQLAAGASATLDVGTLPAPAPGIEGAVGTAMTNGRMRLRLLLGGTLLAEQASRITAADGSAGGRFAMLGAWGRVCGAFVLGRFDIGPCVGVEIDRVSGVAVGAATPVAGARAWGAAFASALGSWMVVRGFALLLRVDGVVPFARPMFVLQGSGGDIVVHRPDPIALRGTLGFEVRFF